MDDAERLMSEPHARDEIALFFTIPKLGRVRANLFLQRGTIGAALRIIPLNLYTIDELSLPPALKEMAMQPQGLIIITGPTGSGKTTTMAAIVEEINRKRHANIFTIEEPIEYIFTDKKSVLHQREVWKAKRSFEAALRSGIRRLATVMA